MISDDTRKRVEYLSNHFYDERCRTELYNLIQKYLNSPEEESTDKNQ